MCVIAVSKTGKRQPTEAELSAMFRRNPDGAGYMVARAGRVEIHKGFMLYSDFARAVKNEHFTEDDAVVYHFRISTQAGVNPEMTQPFPYSKDLRYMRALDVMNAKMGIAHNGIIPLTSDPAEKTYSDTALFIARYLTRIVRYKHDIDSTETQNVIECLIGYSKLAILTGDGGITTIGEFTEDNGILLSNTHHKLQPVPVRTYRPVENYKWQWEF